MISLPNIHDCICESSNTFVLEQGLYAPITPLGTCCMAFICSSIPETGTHITGSIAGGVS